MADLEDQHHQHLVSDAEEKTQIANPYPVDLIVGLKADHTGMAGHLAEAEEFTIHPSAQQRIQAAVGRRRRTNEFNPIGQEPCS